MGIFGVTKTIYREYDSLNRVTKYVDYKGMEVTYVYDALGNMVALTYPGGEIVRYTYNADGSAATMTSSFGGTCYYIYDRYGRLSKIQRPDGSAENNPFYKGGNEADLGNKLGYLFGKASGNKHNIERSKAMRTELQKIGIHNTSSGREYTVTTRESLLMGPGGAVKVESVWDGNRLLTVIVKGGD